MKCRFEWSFRPYIPYDRIRELDNPAITRLAPFEDGCEIEWLPGEGKSFRVFAAPEGNEAWREYPAEGTFSLVTGLKKDYGYRLMIDGHCTPEVVKDMSDLGVDGFILGTSGLFKKGRSYAEQMRDLRGDR